MHPAKAPGQPGVPEFAELKPNLAPSPLLLTPHWPPQRLKIRGD
jgi:hypothetical protein